MLRHWLVQLRSDHEALARDVVDGRRSFWIGSGISRKQAPDLVALIRHALTFLRDRAWDGEADSADHDEALRRILAQHLDHELTQYDAHGSVWEPGDLEGARNSYSEILGTWVNHKPNGNYLLMQGAGVPSRYGDPKIRPGLDHQFLAILIAEGVLSEMASGNWDGLIESAVLEYTGNPHRLSVHVVADDLRDVASVSWLAKFHGCAVRALDDPDKYADSIIATTGQIAAWTVSPTFAHMRGPLLQNVQQFRTLVLGLSVQDADLLDIFTLAASSHPWPWEADHPAYVFAEPKVLPTQETVLANSYAEYGTHRPEILKKSAFGEYSQALLAALATYVVVEKIKAATRLNTDLSAAFVGELVIGISALEALVTVYTGADCVRLVDLLGRRLSHLIRQFYGARHFRFEGSYTPLFDGPLSKVQTDPAVTIMGADRFALAIGLFGRGSSAARWRLRLQDVDEHTFLEVRRLWSPPVLVALVADAASADAIIQLPSWTAGAGDMAIVHAGSQRPNMARSSFGRLGSARGRTSRREIWLPEVVMGVDSMEDALDNLFAGGAA